YHDRHAAAAGSALQMIESQAGKLCQDIRKEMEVHAVNVFGSKEFLPWLLVYSAVQGRPAYHCIPDNFYGAVVYKKINKYGWLSGNKALSPLLIGSDIVDAIGYADAGVIRDDNGYTLSPNQVSDKFFHRDERIIFKKFDSAAGKDVYVLTKNAFTDFASTALPDGVFQQYIAQHTYFNSICNAPATIRLTTIRENNGNISLRAGYLRIGRSSEQHVQSNSSLRIDIDLETSTLHKEGYLNNWY